MDSLADDSYRPRLADARVAELLRDFPAVMITGPRAVGKTSTASRHVADVVRLDRPAEAAAFRADPDAALEARTEPVLLDEWQEVPEVLGAVKRAVDDDGHPGRFVLTGSVRAELQHVAWPGTGRLVRIEMYGLTELEARGLADPRPAGFLERLATADAAKFTVADRDTRLTDYIELALRSGFPEAVTREWAEEARRTWIDSYLDQLLTRDAHEIAPGRDTNKMRRYFEVLALSTAGLPSDATLNDAAGINAKTATAYDRLFADLFVAEQIPAWATNRIARLARTPKRYVVDPALAASAAGLDARSVLRDGDLLGRFVDTYALAQLRPELALSPSRRRTHHLRARDGRHEIDLVVEIEDGGVLALEFKAGAAPGRDDARHLMWLRDEIDERFVAGAVVHTGPDVFELGNRILALPLSTMWG
jgi:predicted AAA+ superfamily ATPase